MNKIVGLLNPFVVDQKFYIYNNSPNPSYIEFQVLEVPQGVVGLSKKYGIKDIDLMGAKKYIEGIKQQILEEEIKKYNMNELNINCI